MRSCSLWHVRITFLYQIYLATSSPILSSLYWSPLNPIFKTNATKNVLLGSRIYIVCPHTVLVPADVSKPLHVEDMFENVWIVDKEGYNSCTVNTTNPRHKHWLNCNATSTLRHRNIIFDNWGSVDQGYIFDPGQEYYVIATSNGSMSSLNNLAGGRCSTHNMKMVFYVCRDKQDPKCNKAAPSTQGPDSRATPSAKPSTPALRKSKKKHRSKDRLGLNKIKRLMNRTRLLPKIQRNSEKIDDVLKLLREMNRKIDSIQALTVEQTGRNCTWVEGRNGTIKRLKCKKIRHIKHKKQKKCKKRKKKRSENKRRSY